MQDIITAKESLQQFERMQALQLWMIAEGSRPRGERDIQAGELTFKGDANHCQIWWSASGRVAERELDVCLKNGL